MKIKKIFLFVSFLLIKTTMIAQSPNSNLGIEETIKYINELVESNAETYPYSQIEGIENGLLIIKDIGCVDKKSWSYWLKNGTETEKKLGICNDSLILHQNRQQVILKNVFFKAESDTLFYLGKSSISISIFGAPKQPIKDIHNNYQTIQKRKVISSFYSFRTKRFQDNEEKMYDDFTFTFNSSQYNIEKLYNSLDHLFNLIMKNPNLWVSKIKDSDPFAPQNYKKNE